MLRRFLLLALLFAVVLSVRAADSARATFDFDANWLFSLSDPAAAMMAAFDDSGWRAIDVPHDWSIAGPFSAQYASGTGYAPGGIGWYRKHFRLDPAQSNRLVTIEFDGIYDNSEIWINGQFVGGRPYGFSSFMCDLTPYIKWHGDNTLAVRVDHSRIADARFYTGSGIDRNIRLVLTDPLHFSHWGIAITTPTVSPTSATVQIDSSIESQLPGKVRFTLESEIIDPTGKTVDNSIFLFSAASNSTNTLTQKIKITCPELWSPATPALYTLVSRLFSDSNLVDDTTTTFGIRTAVFDPDRGFLLNGVTTKLKGVCLHHDAGSLGAAVPEPVLERRLRVLREIGVNAIRTSHNPPDPALLDLCDRLGFFIMDEALDEFTPSKNKWIAGINQGVPAHYGYGEIFDQWGTTDVADMVRRDRNHPSVILWSIGNEIDFANDPFTDPVLGNNYRPGNPPATDLPKCAAPLVAAVKSFDRTRPVTAALATVSMSDAVGLPDLLDAAGYNYQESRYADDHRKFPHRIIYGSENSQTYGAWLAVQTNDFIAGQFLWTGADYLGEANAWPNRANGAGLLDLCSFKKPIGWFRQSLWSDQPMVYLCASEVSPGGFGGGRRWLRGVESWNWSSNSTINVICFANCPEVALYLNDQLIGTKNSSEASNGVLNWRVPYAPGTLKAIGRSNGRDVANFILQTTGPASAIQLLPDTNSVSTGPQKIYQIEFRVTDDLSRRVTDAGDEISFHITGPAKILGIGNGDLQNNEDCQAPQHRVFQGRGLLILQSIASTADAGPITVEASALGLKSATLSLTPH